MKFPSGSWNMAMSPTLKMFTTTVTTDPHYMDPMRAEVQQFHQLGGTLIFGTDVGYMSDYTTEGEFLGVLSRHNAAAWHPEKMILS